MAAIDYLPQLQASGHTTGRVTLYDPTTGLPAGIAVLQGASESAATLRAADGRPLMLRAYVIPRDPRSPAQLSRRRVLAEAVAAYQADPAGARAIVATLPPNGAITIYQQFVGWYMGAYYVPPTGDWDAGATSWDGGATRWNTIPGHAWDGGATQWDGGASIWNIPGPTPWDAGASLWDAGATQFST